ncbi:D-2-hydroxyacid dehydrogenase [Larsenimonas rhizosphaerae]|uniref:D-2-hydroxyacid dehydrogenase n=1 Tax=Larsenimonas rhizosphaerae TaxID=2944682 RepID=A0AA42CTL9_9GAMM|nr:D-2-hydroxyacid dehydrogenase [Larsenimonas rhizosphaerae]MCX2523369.1 D-2-hydroxyacid dehydrogenase [Larsenimonas rhizosphaerae]
MKAVLLDSASLGEGIDFSPLKRHVDTLILHDQTSPADCASRVSEADILLTNKVVINAEVMNAAPNLRHICVLATGTNNIDLEAAEERHVSVSNVENYGTASVAQHTLMMILALATRLPLNQHSVSAGDWQQSPFFCLLDHSALQLAGRHLVIVGEGTLGRRVAEMARAFDMTVTFTARPGSDNDSRPALHDVLPDADIVSLHCPLTEATRHLIDTEALSLMQPHALLVNCARGGIIDEVAALDALRHGRIGGLAVDVLPVEPPRDGHPLIDATSEALNLIVTPHSAWTTLEARQRIIELTSNTLAQRQQG